MTTIAIKKTSQLDSANTAALGDEYFHLVQGGVSKKANLKDYISQPTFANVSVAEATSVSNVSITTIRTLGYASPGDGGGAVYQNVGNTEPSHSGKFQSLDGNWWEVQPGERGHNVRAFGAVGDKANGTTSAHVEFQGAFDAAGEDGTVYVPTGKYSIDNPGTAVGVDVNGGDQRKFIGDNAEIYFPNGTVTSRPLLFRNLSGLEISGFIFRSGITFATDHQNVMALSLMNVSYARIHDNLFNQLTLYGIIVSQDTISETSAACPGLEVYDNVFRRIGGYAIQAFPKVLGGSQVIRNNRFEDCGISPTGTDAGHAIKCGQGYEETLLTGNLYINCGNHSGAGDKSAVAVTNWCRVSIIGETFIDCPSINIAMSMSSHSVYGIIGTFETLMIADNSFNCLVGSTFGDPIINLSSDTDGITEYNSRLGMIGISNNRVHKTSTTQTFILIRPSDALQRVSISGNKGVDLGTYFLYSDDANGGGLSLPEIEGNYVKMRTAATSPAIRIRDSVGGHVLNNSIVRTNTTSMEFSDFTSYIVLLGNHFIRCNASSAANTGAIHLMTSVTPGIAYAYDNSIVTPTSHAALFQTDSAYTIRHSRNSVAAIQTGASSMISEEILGTHTATVSAIDGYITIKDEDGTTRKLATVT